MAVWTGQQLLAWDGQTGTRDQPTVPPNGFGYDPSANRWLAMTPAPLKGRIHALSTWTGTEMLIWGGDP